MTNCKKDMIAPVPTTIYRFLHLDNLEIYLSRSMLHAPNYTPNDGLIYKTIHNLDIQVQRTKASITCDPGGVIHDYVAFYFGRWSPMLLQLKTGQVKGYNEGQEPLIYLVSTVQAVISRGVNFVFSDGHGLVAYTKWYNDLNSLDRVDWSIVDQRYWSDNSEDGDRKRRKQAEFLVHQECPWELVRGITVLSQKVKSKVQEILAKFPKVAQPSIQVEPSWYY